VQAKIEEAVAKGRPKRPRQVTLQTRTTAYGAAHWVRITKMERHWEDARVDATLDDAGNVTLTTKNVAGLALQLTPLTAVVKINGKVAQGLRIGDKDGGIFSWPTPETGSGNQQRGKSPGLQGPMDDAFKSRFLLVLPDQPADGSAVDAWARAEAAHFTTRWRGLMRGDLRSITADKLTDEEADKCHLIVWGTPKTNTLLQKLLAAKSISKVLTWNEQEVKIGTHRHPAANHVPLLCQPNPMNPAKYVVINTGLTFREAHDRTNSLQNPKLPDWAILDITQPANAESAGKVAAADFFDEQWQ
jgi:hypothetical protein